MKLATASLDKTVVIARIKAEGSVAVIRTDSIERALGAANAVIAGGFRVIEITYSFNGAQRKRSRSCPTLTKTICSLVPERFCIAGRCAKQLVQARGSWSARACCRK